MLMLFSTPMIAGDSGTYFDSARPGEGMLLQRDGDTMMFFLFTFGAHGCYEYAYPMVGPFIERDYDCERQGDRWFYASNKYFAEEDELSGFIYMAYGTNWPEGIQTLDVALDPGHAARADIERDVNQDRPRPAGPREVERFADDVREALDLMRVLDEVVVLRDGDCDAGGIGLLEAVRAHQTRVHLAGNCHHT